MLAGKERSGQCGSSAKNPGGDVTAVFEGQPEDQDGRQGGPGGAGSEAEPGSWPP